MLEGDNIAGEAVQLVLASLDIESLSRLIICSHTLKRVCHESRAADGGEPRFKFNDEEVDTEDISDPNFTQSSSHTKFKLLFRFQQQRFTALLSGFDLGGRSMHRGVSRWSTPFELMLSFIYRKHNQLGEVAPRRSHLLQVKNLP